MNLRHCFKDRKDPVKHGSISAPVLPCPPVQAVFGFHAPPMWLRLSSGTAITTQRLGHGTEVASLGDPSCPVLDLTGTCPSSANAL
jgi:hypothetical protein